MDKPLTSVAIPTGCFRMWGANAGYFCPVASKRMDRPQVVCEVHSSENLEAIHGLILQSGYRMTLLDPGGRFPAHIAAEADWTHEPHVL